VRSQWDQDLERVEHSILVQLGIVARDEEEALATGLTLDELRSRSFVKILAGRCA
jgi:hypothetical protein